jgi:hypothetical protein
MMTRYWIERFPLYLFLPTAALLALAAQATVSPDAMRWARETAVALLLLAQFRLWDDIADRERDRVAHPGRTLIQAPGAAPFVLACLALATINAACVAAVGGFRGVSGLIALDAAALVWYVGRPAQRTVARDLVLLSKYPAFVLVLAVGSTPALSDVGLPALGIYLAACAYEMWHDASGPLRALSQ